MKEIKIKIKMKPHTLVILLSLLLIGGASATAYANPSVYVNDYGFNPNQNAYVGETNYYNFTITNNDNISHQITIALNDKGSTALYNASIIEFTLYPYQSINKTFTLELLTTGNIDADLEIFTH